MNSGKIYKAGDIILARLKFVDSEEYKVRPAVILFVEFNNYIIAGITSNLNMKGIKLTKVDGMLKESIIKLNYIFTIPKERISKKILELGESKRNILHIELNKRISKLLF
jgi:mRNA-degrading endonuclease toxin of MazEF toxin-antitoxin module